MMCVALYLLVQLTSLVDFPLERGGWGGMWREKERLGVSERMVENQAALI